MHHVQKMKVSGCHASCTENEGLRMSCIMYRGGLRHSKHPICQEITTQIFECDTAILNIICFYLFYFLNAMIFYFLFLILCTNVNICCVIDM